MTANNKGRNLGRGAFISFEGGDGAGKSTQIKLLATRLHDTGLDVVVTREPGGAPGAEAIRDLVVRGDCDRWSSRTEALLVYAARSDHLERTIVPAIEQGAIVISDRFSDSSMAYQGIAGGLGRPFIENLERLVVAENGPDLTIILDVSSAQGLARVDDRIDEIDGDDLRFEGKGEAFQTAVNLAFREIAKSEPERCVLVDACQSIEAVAEDVASAVKSRMGLAI